MRFEHEIHQGEEFLHSLRNFLNSSELLEWDKERDQLKAKVLVLEESIKIIIENRDIEIEKLEMKIARHGIASGEILKLLERCLPYLNLSQKNIRNNEGKYSEDLKEITDGIRELK